MQLGGDERCRLLFVVYPIFVEALPTVSAPSCQPSQFADGPIPGETTLSRDNFITELRDEIKKIGINFNEEDALCELQKEVFQDAVIALDQILFLFEDLVHERLGNLVHDSLANVIPNDSKNEHLEEQFPKLVKLKYAKSSHHAKASSLISFGTEPRVYRRIISTAQLFNRNIKRIYSRAGEKPDNQSFLPIQRDEHADSATLAEALRLSETSQRLFAFLEGSICQKVEGSHEGYLRLSDFDQPELDMLLSVCGVEGRWQQAYFYPPHKGAQGAMAKSICDELMRSRKLRQPIRMAIGSTGDETSLHKLAGSRSHIKSIKVQPPTSVTLGHILRDENRRRQEGPRHRTVKLNKKRGLGVKIAASLLRFFGNPLLHVRPWNADSIYISHDDAGDSDPQAYLSFCLSSQDSAPIRPQVDADGCDPSLLALTTILLELETEREIIPCDEDKDEFSGEPSLYLAVLRHHEELEDNVDANFHLIIGNCLDLYDDSHYTDGCHTKMQIELFNKVVVPLTERYATLRNEIQRTARQTRDVNRGLSMDSGLATWRGGQLEGPDRRMDTIAERAEEIAQSEANLVTPPNPSLTIVEEPQFLAGRILDGWTWLGKVDRTNALMESMCGKHPIKNKVRIAILDTGCDVGANCIVNLSDGEARLEGHWKDWAGVEMLPIDEDPEQHGTAAVALLLRVARHAEIFVGRIAKNQAGLNEAEDNIVEAISHAAWTWKVDIVSMSFGFKTRIPSVEKVIRDTIMKRRDEKKDILFFAAANNDGLNEKEMFPASDSNVISVRGTDHSGAFLQKYNPDPWPNKQGMPRFGTLAENVCYDCADRSSIKSGCSFATPILAGLVATVIHYVEHKGDMSLQRHMRTRDGILQVMDHMAYSNDRGYKYLAPWKFFERSDEERIALIRNALAALQRTR